MRRSEYILIVCLIALPLFIGATYRAVHLESCINASVNVTLSDYNNRYQILGCHYNNTLGWACNESCTDLIIHLQNETNQTLYFKIGYYWLPPNNSPTYRYIRPVVKLPPYVKPKPILTPITPNITLNATEPHINATIPLNVTLHNNSVFNTTIPYNNTAQIIIKPSRGYKTLSYIIVGIVVLFFWYLLYKIYQFNKNH